MRIFIPTMGRVGKQKTLEALGPIADTYKATLVCPPAEVNALADSCSAAVVGCRVKGIAATRQWILEYSDDPVVLMLDDDLNSWSTRRVPIAGHGGGWLGDEKPNPINYSKSTPKELKAGFAEFVKLMGTHAHGGIGHRQFANARERVALNTRLLRALAYNRDVMKEQGVKFRIPVMEDFDVQLQLMKRGFWAVQFNGIVQDQPASNAAGGCSTYRTQQVQEEAAHRLAKLHPDCVTVVTKEGWKGDMAGTRTDVRVSWRAAVKAGGAVSNAR